MQKIDSTAISFLRFPLMVGVVCMHTDIRVYCPWVLDLPVTQVIMHLIINVLSGVSIPAFFFISGYLFFHEKTYSLNIYKQKIITRFRTICIPYILWNLICFAIIWMLQAIIPGFLLLLHKPINSLSCSDFLFLFWDISQITHLPDDQHGPLIGQFWFLQCLIFLTILSPIIYIANKRLKYVFPVCLGIIYVFLSPPTCPGVDWKAYFYFSLGAYFSIHSISLHDVTKKISCYVYPLCFICTIASFFIYDIIILNNILMLIISFDIIYRIIARQYKLPSILISSSFFIFAVHRFFTAVMTNLAKNEIILTRSELSASCYFMIGTFLVIIICISLYWIMQRYIPRTIIVLTGGRIYHHNKKQ